MRVRFESIVFPLLPQSMVTETCPALSDALEKLPALPTLPKCVTSPRQSSCPRPSNEECGCPYPRESGEQPEACAKAGTEPAPQLMPLQWQSAHPVGQRSTAACAGIARLGRLHTTEQPTKVARRVWPAHVKGPVGQTGIIPSGCVSLGTSCTPRHGCCIWQPLRPIISSEPGFETLAVPSR